MELPPIKHDKCGTTDCCMQCDTADLGKDWYLISINTQYKNYVNSKTGERKQIPLEKT